HGEQADLGERGRGLRGRTGCSARVELAALVADRAAVGGPAAAVHLEVANERQCLLSRDLVTADPQGLRREAGAVGVLRAAEAAVARLLGLEPVERVARGAVPSRSEKRLG